MALISVTGESRRTFRVREKETNLHHANDMDFGNDSNLFRRYVHGTHLYPGDCDSSSDHLFQRSYCHCQCAE